MTTVSQRPSHHIIVQHRATHSNPPAASKNFIIWSIKGREGGIEVLVGGWARGLEGQGGARGGRPDVERGAAAAAAADACAAAADDDAEVAFNATRASDLIMAAPPAGTAGAGAATGTAGAGAAINDDDGDAVVTEVNDNATKPGSVKASANAAVATVAAVAAGAAAELIAGKCS
jgi:hypothetical protein